MQLGKYGKVKLLCGGKEFANLTFYDGLRKRLAIGMEAYGNRPEHLIFDPWRFVELRDVIWQHFKQEWEPFMFDLQAALRAENFCVDINGILELPEGKILRDPEYAKPPRPFGVSQFELPQNILFRSKARFENRDRDLQWSWIGGIAMIVALAAGIFVLL